MPFLHATPAPSSLVRQFPRLLRRCAGLALAVLVLAVAGVACDATANEATPGATPTATALPTGAGRTPLVEVVSLDVMSGQRGAMEVRARDMPRPGLAGFTVDLFFDPSVMQVESVADGDAAWAGVTANIDNPNGHVRLVGVTGAAVPGSSVLAVLHVDATGVAGERSDVQVVVDRLADGNLQDIPAAQSQPACLQVL